MNEWITPWWLMDDTKRELHDREVEARIRDLRRNIALCEGLSALEWQPGAMIRVRLPQRFEVK